MLQLLINIILAALAILTVSFFFKCLTLSRRLSGLPGPPSPSLLFGNILDLEKAKVGTRYNAWAKKYGQAYKITGPLAEPYLILSDPKGIRHVLSAFPSNYPRPESDRIILETMFGRGVLCAEGEEHRRIRKSLNRAFRLAIEEISPTLFELADKLVMDWTAKIDQESGDAAVLDITKTIHVTALDAISMTMLKYNCSASQSIIPSIMDKINEPMGHTLSLILETLSSLFPILLHLPSPIMDLFKEMKSELRKIAEEVRSSGTERNGMHSKLLDIIRENGDFEGSIAQIIEVLFAGSETSANVICECVYELSQNSRVQKKLRQELATFETINGRQATYHDLMNQTALPYFDAVIRETLRTKSVLMEISRSAAIKDTIPLQYPIVGTNAHHVVVEPGQLIQIPIRDGVNVDPTLWGANADQFWPERWIQDDGLPPAVRDVSAHWHMMTFGDGPKVCLGRLFGERMSHRKFKLSGAENPLALAEVKIMIATLSRNFVFEKVDAIDFYHIGGNTVKPTVRGKEAEGVQLPLRISKAGKEGGL